MLFFSAGVYVIWYARLGSSWSSILHHVRVQVQPWAVHRLAGQDGGLVDGHFSRRNHAVDGQLQPDTGTVDVYSMRYILTH